MTKSAGPRPEWVRILLRACLIVCAFVAMVAFSAVLARLTLSPSAASEGVASANLRPGVSLRQYAEDYTFLAAAKQVGGNVLLGVPFGVLLPVLLPRTWRLLRVMMLTVLVMALVELAQGAMITGRAFDVDDVIMNTTGALIGYLLLGRRLGRAWRRRRGEREQPGHEPAEPAREPEGTDPERASAPAYGGMFRWRRRPVPPRP